MAMSCREADPFSALRTGRAEGRRLMTEGLLRYRPALGEYSGNGVMHSSKRCPGARSIIARLGVLRNGSRLSGREAGDAGIFRQLSARSLRFSAFNTAEYV